jgi:hypothetical protein
VLDGLVRDFTTKLNVEPAAIGLLPKLRLAVKAFALEVQVAEETSVPEPHKREAGKMKLEGNVSFN